MSQEAKRTINVVHFMEENATCAVVAGEAFPKGGGRYKLANELHFNFTLEEMRSMPMPKWPWDFPGYKESDTQDPEGVDLG